MVVTKTRHGLRLCQHGVVISELRTSPGPTHSVFDVLAALIVGARSRSSPPGLREQMTVARADRGSARAPRRVAVLGFAGGGMMAPLRALSHEADIETCDLDQPAYELFRRHCPQWAGQVQWHHADAAAWLKRQAGKFGLIVDDLSVPVDGDVFKPSLCWEILPQIIQRKLCPDGLAVFNLLPPAQTWARRSPEFGRLAALFSCSRLVTLEDYENRILVAGAHLATAPELGRTLRGLLRQMGSRQRDRVRVRTVDN